MEYSQASRVVLDSSKLQSKQSCGRLAALTSYITVYSYWFPKVIAREARYNHFIGLLGFDP